MIKTSIRFFEDIPVRAVWNDDDSKWWFCAMDIAEALTKSKNPRVYWAQMKRRNPQLITICKQLKLTARDGKSYLTDVVDGGGVNTVVALIPAKNRENFVRWLSGLGSTIDEKSKQKAYELLERDTIDQIEIAHPFMEGNGRSMRIWLDLILKKNLQKCVDWSKIDKRAYLEAMRKSPVDATDIFKLVESALTDKIHDRELFMKGIDYSYYYEEA